MSYPITKQFLVVPQQVILVFPFFNDIPGILLSPPAERAAQGPGPVAGAAVAQHRTPGISRPRGKFGPWTEKSPE